MVLEEGLEPPVWYACLQSRCNRRYATPACSLHSKVLSCKFSREVANLTKPMQLCQDPFPAGWTRIAIASYSDTLITLYYGAGQVKCIERRTGFEPAFDN